MPSERVAYQVHVCLYSPLAPPFEDVFAAGDSLASSLVADEKSVASTSFAKPRTLYEIARKVDRPLDARLSPLSLQWLDRPQVGVSKHGATPKKSRGVATSRQSSMSPDARRSASVKAEQNGAASVVPPSSPGGAMSATPIARFEKESSFNIDGNGDEQQHGAPSSGASEVAFGIVHLFRDDASLNNPASAKTKTTLEDDSGTVLAVLGVPTHIGPADFLRLIEPAADAISQVRMIREEVANRCMVLLKFRDAANAEEFHKMYADQPFDPVEMPNELCRVVYITKVSVSTTSTLPYAYPLLANSDPWPIMHHDHHEASASATTKALAELPTCPVCLERMDASVTGLMTVTCQHTFHCSCLSKWSDSRCPVCRYTQSRLTRKGHNALPSFVPENGRCAVCGTGADLWVCLICATVGCGRYKAGHAHRHYHETGHLYSLELETQRVWDYAGDGYVHRLIQNKAEYGMIDDHGPTPKASLESSKPSASSKEGSSAMEATSSSAGQATHTAEIEEKMEALGLEYSNLLSTQLESQRAFYEDQVRAYQVKAEEAESSRGALTKALTEAQKERDDVKGQLEGVRSRSEHLASNMDVSLKRVKKLDEELRAERQMSQGLVGRIDKLVAEGKTRADDVAALRVENVELKEQVRDLMFFVEARAKVDNEGGEELRGGDVEVGKARRKQQQQQTQQQAATDSQGNAATSTTKSKKKKKGKSKAGALATASDAVANDGAEAPQEDDLAGTKAAEVQQDE